MKRFVLKPIVLVFAFLSMAISAFGQSNTTNNKNNRQMEKSTMKLKIEGGRTFTATLVDNSSTKALKELLAKGDITVHMEDYASMEKVGSLGTSLPRNDRQTTTQPGDLILYLGNSFVIYYDTNSWNFTRLGRLDGVSTRQEVLELLGGKGDITVTLSIK